LATIDRAFIATNVRKREPGFDITGPDTVGNCMCRFEFLEVIVRLSVEKFRGSNGSVKNLSLNFSNGLERLINECLIPNFHPGEQGQDWRDF
jgi:hypothetical protein